jgi:hypothetical protein
VLAGAVMLAPQASTAPARAQAEACGGIASYGYVHHRRDVSCRRAKHVARRAYRKGYLYYTHDCGPAHTWRMRVWRIHGPIKGGLTYKFTAPGGRRFYTTKPTDCL